MACASCMSWKNSRSVLQMNFVQSICKLCWSRSVIYSFVNINYSLFSQAYDLYLNYFGGWGHYFELYRVLQVFSELQGQKQEKYRLAQNVGAYFLYQMSIHSFLTI
jgi:hypothetical protein